MSTKGLLSLLPHDQNRRRISWGGTRVVWGSVCIKINTIAVQKKKEKERELTTGNRTVAECPQLCRVPTSRHSANTRHTACRKFAECRPSAKIEHSAYFMFAECRWARTRQRSCMCPARAPAVRRPSGCPFAFNCEV